MSKPFLADIMRSSGVHDAESARAYFREYAKKVIGGELGLFSRYGISLEAHQQNSYDVFTTNGHLARRMVQDLADGAQIYCPVYQLSPERADEMGSAIEDLPAAAYKFNLAQRIDEPLRQLVHTTFRCHLFPVTAITASEFGVSKTELLNIMREEIHHTLDSARHNFMPQLPLENRALYAQFLDEIEDGLLRKPTLAKAFLTTLIAGDLSGYIDKSQQINPFDKLGTMAVA